MKAHIALIRIDMDSLKSTDINMLWGTVEVDSPRVEITPRAPHAEPSRAEDDDEEFVIRSSDDEEDAERERSV